MGKGRKERWSSSENVHFGHRGLTCLPKSLYTCVTTVLTYVNIMGNQNTYRVFILRYGSANDTISKHFENIELTATSNLAQTVPTISLDIFSKRTISYVSALC